ncbi:hypothetical protein F4782DRAFT_523620 [Xylaria castorea]|nr:hypothetical protein F4782DRAFT_523620 [Xylaria castorea]
MLESCTQRSAVTYSTLPSHVSGQLQHNFTQYEHNRIELNIQRNIIKFLIVRSLKMDPIRLLSLSLDILIILPEYLHTIEDLMNTASTCRALRAVMATATPKVILRLAVAQARVFFRPSPHFLATAAARQLGNWARESAANEKELAIKMGEGIDGLLDLALDHSGLTMERIRELHLLRFSLINPVTDIIDQCVGKQWSQTPNFWVTVDDAHTISAEPSETLFHLAMYGELFAPDFEAILNRDANARRLSVETRLEFIKYCVPDFVCFQDGHMTARDVHMPDGSVDPRRRVKATGPYAPLQDGKKRRNFDNNLALTWVIRSGRFRPRYAEIRAKAGVTDFQEHFDDRWWYGEALDQDWRQRLLEDIMMCQGLEGLGMLRPDTQDQWMEKIREWRDKIAKLDREPPLTQVGRQATLEYPYLLGDLRICVSGYHGGS